MIVDDEREVHKVTRFVLDDYSFMGKQPELISAYSEAEARKLIRKHEDTALILLDIVMEEENSGLKFVRFVRDKLKNYFVRLILRTAYPGQAPEEEVIFKYEINDYKDKTELTDKKFITSVTAALRSYSDLLTIDSYRKNLEDKVKERTSELEKKNRELSALNKELERLSTTDALTGVFNRRHFNNVIDTEIKRALRYNHYLSLIIFDIDHFKVINDNYGHTAGDNVLINITALVKKNIRESDLFARWGGEEFIVLMPEININEAEIAAEKLREIISGFRFHEAGYVTSSFGVTQFQKTDDCKSFIKRADDALYNAKSSGRNTVMAGPP